MKKWLCVILAVILVGGLFAVAASPVLGEGPTGIDAAIVEELNRNKQLPDGTLFRKEGEAGTLDWQPEFWRDYVVIDNPPMDKEWEGVDGKLQWGPDAVYTGYLEAEVWFYDVPDGTHVCFEFGISVRPYWAPDKVLLYTIYYDDYDYYWLQIAYLDVDTYAHHEYYWYVWRDNTYPNAPEFHYGVKDNTTGQWLWYDAYFETLQPVGTLYFATTALEYWDTYFVGKGSGLLDKVYQIDENTGRQVCGAIQFATDYTTISDDAAHIDGSAWWFENRRNVSVWYVD